MHDPGQLPGGNFGGECRLRATAKHVLPQNLSVAQYTYNVQDCTLHGAGFPSWAATVLDVQAAQRVLRLRDGAAAGGVAGRPPAVRPSQCG